jgi:hypothetical protein
MNDETFALKVCYQSRRPKRNYQLATTEAAPRRAMGVGEDAKTVVYESLTRFGAEIAK